MKRESIGIVGACALGALIGTLVALDIATRFEYGRYFWSVGALFGGIVAYIAVDIHKLVAGIVRAYRATLSHFAQKSRFYWRIIAPGLVSLAFLEISWAVAAVAMFLLGNTDLATIALVFSGVLFFPVNSLWAIDDTPANGNLSFGQRRGYVEWHRVCIGALAIGNPIVLPFSLIAGMVWLLWTALRQTKLVALWIGSFTVRAIKAIGQFVKYTFIYIHSQRRTICFVDATLGAAVGHSFGSALVGAIAGALLGLVNYELVSVRWLKLSPAPAETTRV